MLQQVEHHKTGNEELQEAIQAELSLKTKSDRTYVLLEGLLAMEALGDRVIILEDKMKTGFECKTCGGEGFDSNILCNFCHGTKIDNAGACRVCSVPDDFGTKVSTGFKACTDCSGKGASLIVPQNAERRPTTGKIYSVGPDVGLCICIKPYGVIGINCKFCQGSGYRPDRLKIGDHVQYGNYSGQAINIGPRTVIRIMHENEAQNRLWMGKDFNYATAAKIIGG